MSCDNLLWKNRNPECIDQPTLTRITKMVSPMSYKWSTCSVTSLIWTCRPPPAKPQFEILVPKTGPLSEHSTFKRKLTLGGKTQHVEGETRKGGNNPCKSNLFEKLRAPFIICRVQTHANYVLTRTQSSLVLPIFGRVRTASNFPN